MSVLYKDLTDAELQARLVKFRDAYEEAMAGKVAIVVAGEGRRVEYTRANSEGLLGLIKALSRELDERKGVQISGAIGVVFPYGGSSDGY